MTVGKPPGSYEYDPVFLHARREAFVIVGLFAIFCGWSLAVSFSSGYQSPGASGAQVDLVLGMPSWVFWGIFLPWVVVDVVAVWFCFFFMKNDDLGEAHEGEDLAEQLEGEADHG